VEMFWDTPGKKKFPGTFSQKNHRSNADMLCRKYNLEIQQVQPRQNSIYYILETPGGENIKALCRQLRHEPFVIDASPDYFATIAVTSTPTNDPYFFYQYALVNVGQVYRPETGSTGTPGSDIKALEGWDWSTGSEDIIIAVLDSGVALNHEDLQNKLVPGFNIIAGNTNPADDHGHGTFVASIAAAETNNGVGMAGVGRLSKIMPIKVMDSDGNGTYLAIAAGMR
ncbi:MAG: S8 family serine peptidase, partial [bacterium]|nr:S8 family serine peptidase [bacterium]